MRKSGRAESSQRQHTTAQRSDVSVNTRTCIVTLDIEGGKKERETLAERKGEILQNALYRMPNNRGEQLARTHGLTSQDSSRPVQLVFQQQHGSVHRHINIAIRMGMDMMLL